MSLQIEISQHEGKPFAFITLNTIVLIWIPGIHNTSRNVKQTKCTRYSWNASSIPVTMDDS